MERESDSSTVGQVEPKHLEISTEPLSLTATRRSKMVLVQADPNCLEFRPSKWSLFFDGIFVAVFLLLLVWDLFSSHYWLALLWALILVAEFFRIRAALGSWVRLDRNTNTLERRLDREFGPLITLAHLLIEGRDSVRRRLTNVIAIQLLKERF